MKNVRYVQGIPLVTAICDFSTASHDIMSLMRSPSEVAGTRLLPQLIDDAAVSVESSME